MRGDKAKKVVAALALAGVMSLTWTGTARAVTCSQADGVTAKSAGVGGGRTVELRYSPSTRCAWGRIIQANGGDQVKAERNDGAKTSTVTVGGGSTQAFTTAMDDAGFQMRAWGKYERGIYPDQSAWTAWY